MVLGLSRISAAIQIYSDFGFSNEDICQKLMALQNLSKEEAMEYIKKYKN